MSKTKTPFLSLGSSGTVGKILTSQKRGAQTLLRAKPTPTDPYSLPQAYQRWLYQDYCAEWSALSEADKQTWRSAASRFHMPGMAYFLRNRLNTLPDIAGGWHLDYITGSSVIDFSKNLNHGTVYGATLVDGVIDHALSFDGIDDYVNCGHDSSFDITTAITLEAFVTRNGAQVSWAQILGKNIQLDYMLRFFNDGQSVIFLINAGAVVTASYLLPDGETTHIVGIYPGTTPNRLELYINGNLEKWSAAYSGAISSHPADDVVIGGRSPGVRVTNAVIDHAIIYNRALTASDILRHSLRRYPS